MNKHFWIDPNGEKHTRNSKTRIYTHATVIVTRTTDWLAEAQADAAKYPDTEVYAKRVANAQAAIDAGITEVYSVLSWNSRADLAGKVPAWLKRHPNDRVIAVEVETL